MNIGIADTGKQVDRIDRREEMEAVKKTASHVPPFISCTSLL